MDIESLYRDYNITYVTEGYKHTRDGWVNVSCPFCTGNFGYHLGYDIFGDKFVCWRCGGHGAVNSISALLRVGKSEAHKILRQYGVLVGKAREMKRKPRVKAFRLPKNSEELKNNHRKYLINRGFDPDKLINDWGILGTSVSAPLDKLNYKHRLIIPFFWNGEMVSFDSRDITNKANNKYMACPEERELIGHKDILYGRQDKWSDVGICVEGSTDVWRMGFDSFAVSGIKFKPSQIRVIKKQFKRVPVLFDDDPQAIIQANKLVADLRFRGVDSFRVDIEGDPGSLSEEEANYLIKQLI